MATGYYKITIATKPYLKKYLQSLYGSPLSFQQDREFGMTIAAYLERPLRMKDTPPAAPIILNCGDTMAATSAPAPLVLIRTQQSELTMRLDRFDSLVQINISKRSFTRYSGGLEIKPAHVIVINQLFDKRFTEELYKKSMLLNLLGLSWIDAYKAFCDQYKIEIPEDITMDALKKKENRFRKKVEESSPNLSLEGTRKNLASLMLSNFNNLYSNKT